MLFHLQGLYRIGAGGKKRQTYCRWYFHIFLTWKKLDISICISLDLQSNSEKVIVRSGNGFAPHRRRTITWTNGPVPWHIGALSGPSVILEKTLPFKAKWTTKVASVKFTNSNLNFKVWLSSNIKRVLTVQIPQCTICIVAKYYYFVRFISRL